MQEVQSCDQNRQAETQPALGELKIITEKRRYIYTLKIIIFIITIIYTTYILQYSTIIYTIIYTIIKEGKRCIVNLPDMNYVYCQIWEKRHQYWLGIITSLSSVGFSEQNSSSYRVFPGASVVKNLLSNSGDMALIPGQGIKFSHAVGQLMPLATSKEKTAIHNQDTPQSNKQIKYFFK